MTELINNSNNINYTSYFNDVPEGKEFFLYDKKIKNLHGLLFELRSMSNETYNHFVNNEHNYFSDWIEYVIKFKELADLIRSVLDRKEAISLIEKKIEELKNKENQKASVKIEEKKENKIIEEKKDIIEKKEPDRDLKKETLNKFEIKNEISEIKKQNLENTNKDDKLKEEVKFKEEVKQEQKELTEKQRNEKNNESELNDYNQMKKEILKEKIKHDEKYGHEFLWKHFAWEMAKEFMYGMAIGILIGFVLAKIFLR
ncbi:MAG: hypothetical protein QW757_05665 [Candidatus Woesearchaeota archaeon]